MLDRTDRLAWTAALAALDPPPRDVFAEIGYQPTPKQQTFHDAEEFVILFGGSLGGGKSRALMAEAIRACALHPGIRVGAFRRTYGELKESLVPELAAMRFGADVGGTWNGTDFDLRFANGSLLMLRYVENLADATRRQGGQYQLLLFDELNLLSPDAVAFLESRLRSGRADLPVLGIRATANPGGPGHGAVRARFIDATNYGANVITDAGGRTLRFIPSSSTDNPHLNTEYVQHLAALPENMRRAMRDGDWDAFSGQIFVELSHDRHVVAPIQLPPSWKRYIGLDWGYTAPYAVVWGAVDEDGRVWLYREIYARQVGETEQARRVLDAEQPGEVISGRYADDALWETRGEARVIADVYAEQGVHLTKAGKGPGSRVQGLQRIHTFLQEGPACPHHRALGWDTCPMLHMFPQLDNLFRELRDLPYASKGNPEAADAGAPDHACLIAGSLVLTSRGEVPIEGVTTADCVLTRKGWRRVLAAGLTGRQRQVVTIATSDGRRVTLTPNHPVFVAGKGWTRTDALSYRDRLVTWQDPKSSCSTASPSAAIQTPNDGRTASTSRPESPTSNEASGASIKRFGRPPTARSQRATTSITRTRIPSTTTSAIWRASWATITSLSTCPTSAEPSLLSGWRAARKRWQKPLSGTPVKLAANGTDSTPCARGSGMFPRDGYPATSAANCSIATSPPGREGSARTGVLPRGAEPPVSMTKTEPAHAGRPSASTGIALHAPALAAVVNCSDAGRADVYNLTVEGEPEFFANGVLVHNCDALSYLLRNLGTGPDFLLDQPELADPQTPLPTPFAGRYAVPAETQVWDDGGDEHEFTPGAVRTV